MLRCHILRSIYKIFAGGRELHLKGEDMEKFNLSDRYRLELHWKKAVYEQEGICKLEKAYFSGPALADALKLQDNDHILLDFFRQYVVIVKNVYVAKFSWGEVTYNKNGTISLKNTFITHDTELNRVPKLKNKDYLVIDTSNHEVEKHPFNTVYRTYVVNNDTTLYKFGR